jgi:oxygen-dependent protoporphyrinogen oxidase
VRPGRVVVVGGGVSGLATAFHLRTLGGDAPPEVLLLESDDRAGGKIRTDADGGCVRERGPNGFLDNVPETLDLVRALGLEGRLRRASERAAARFLLRGPGLWKLPSTRGEFLGTRLLSLRAKVRILMEPFAKGPPEGDETVHDFARRRIGEEPARVLVSALVAGIYAGDARELSLRSALPAMHAMEREHGSLFRAMKAKARAARERRERETADAVAAGPGGGARPGPAGSPFGPGGTLTTFDGGMQVLTDALAAALGPAVRTGRRAMGLAREGERWVVQAADGETFRADAVVVATPAPDAAMLVGRFDSRFRPVLDAIPMAPVAVVSLRYPEEAAPKAKAGFGFLVPAEEPCRLLGVLWDSTVFEGRAPSGEVLVRAMVGGARRPELVPRVDAELLGIVREELRRTMAIEAEPTEARVYRWPQGIPQYTVGHAERLERLDALLAEHPGLRLTGNSYRGVAMNLCCRDALATARAVLGLSPPE